VRRGCTGGSLTCVYVAGGEAVEGARFVETDAVRRRVAF
jgi:hypothetical protein